MDTVWLRETQKLEFKDPADFLVNLRRVEPALAASDMPAKVKNLRTHELKEWRELRQAALFCHGMGQRIGRTIYLARGESQDYDFVASWKVGDQSHIAPVQLKEVVPTKLNPRATLEATINGLTKYVDSRQLTVAIHLNQGIHIDFRKLTVPPLRIAALWVFASLAPDQSTWGLWGNFLEQSEFTRFDYPA